MDLNRLNRRPNYSFDNIRDEVLRDEFLELARGNEDNQDLLLTRILERIRERTTLMGNEIDWRVRLRRPELRCSYCGRFIPRGRDACEWCGYRRDDDDDFFPYPFIFRGPGGGGGGSMKGEIAVHVAVKN